MIREIKVIPERLDLKARREILVRLVLLVHRGPKVSRVFKDRRVKRVILVIMVFHLLLL